MYFFFLCDIQSSIFRSGSYTYHVFPIYIHCRTKKSLGTKKCSSTEGVKVKIEKMSKFNNLILFQS